MTYIVLVDDNFHFMDESHRTRLGEFPTADAAIEASKQIVDEYLLSVYVPGMTAQALFDHYKFGGEDPFITPNPLTEPKVSFLAWDYAKRRAEEMCELVEPSK